MIGFTGIQIMLNDSFGLVRSFNSAAQSILSHIIYYRTSKWANKQHRGLAFSIESEIKTSIFFFFERGMCVFESGRKNRKQIANWMEIFLLLASSWLRQSCMKAKTSSRDIAFLFKHLFFLLISREFRNFSTFPMKSALFANAHTPELSSSSAATRPTNPLANPIFGDQFSWRPRADFFLSPSDRIWIAFFSKTFLLILFR